MRWYETVLLILAVWLVLAIVIGFFAGKYLKFRSGDDS